MISTKELNNLKNDFYIEILMWLENKHPNRYSFYKEHGLCINFVKYVKKRILDNTHEYNIFYEKFLSNDFISAGLSPEYPFNEGHRDFVVETYLNKLYNNERRLNFIKQQVVKINASKLHNQDD